MIKPVRRWTAEEIEKLKAIAGKLPTGTIAEQLGRDPMSVAVKAHLGAPVAVWSLACSISHFQISCRLGGRPSQASRSME
ncbi:hypothetical protein [Bradyrhizobium erythrophlei]|uniref:hypothetical protein n=1 Tax=Bradyrhizobium erythrophlei TaxID=1437360 RepID=UPI001160072F|nr:hypothetical protein [Bradyrhizobium erythrophlei]